MLLKSFNTVMVDNVTLDTSARQIDNAKSSLSMRLSVGVDPAESQKSNNNYEHMRLRIVVAYTPRSCEALDFITQRFDEYLKFESTDPKFMIRTPGYSYVNFLKEDMKLGSQLCKDPYEFLKEASPLSPFSTKKNIVEKLFDKKYSFDGDGSKLAAGTAMYDASLLEVVSPEIASLIRGKNYKELPSKISINPTTFRFHNISLRDHAEISAYAYVYDIKDSQNNTLPQISLNTGMSSIASINVKGKQYRWRSNSQSVPFLGMRSQTEEVEETDRPVVYLDFSDDIDIGYSIADKLDKRMYGDFSRTFGRSNPGLQKVLKDKNFFSNFWITKDSMENQRFSFAFDIESYLSHNSLFPFLYQHPRTSKVLIDGSGIMTSQIPSYIINMKSVRRFIDPLDLAPRTNLPTSGYSTNLGPSEVYRDKVINDIRRIKVTLPDGFSPDSPDNKVVFYEGTDTMSKPVGMNSRFNNSFKYGAQFMVYDAAPVFMRETLKTLMSARQLVSHIYHKIVTSRPLPYRTVRINSSDLRGIYDNNTNKLTARTSQISLLGKEVNIGHNGPLEVHTVEHFLKKTVLIFNSIVDSFLEEQRIVEDYFLPRLMEQADTDFISVGHINELVNLLDVVIHLFNNRVSDIYSHNPIGGATSHRKQVNLNQRGILDFSFPLLKGETFFDKKVNTNKDYGLGTEYIKEKEEDIGGHKGLSRVDVDTYTQRYLEETSKYFFGAGANNLQQPVNSIIGSAETRYLTPKYIRIPQRPTLDQMKFKSENVPEMVYNLDDYAQLFVDIIRHRNLVNSQGLTNPVILDDNPSDPKNDRLYDSLVRVLGEEYATKITDESSFVYETLDPSTGDKVKSTIVDNLSNLKITKINGPLAIPSIIGGQNNYDPATLTYVSTVDTSLKADYDNIKPGSQKEKKRILKNLDRPIVLPFAIFGELSIDKKLSSVLSYQEKIFNSMKNLCLILGLTEHNIVNVLGQGQFSDVPSSIKSMLILAATREVNEIGSPPVDAIRPVLKETEAGEAEELISFHRSGLDVPPYQATYDPMKKYAKFMAFWMNYKEIAVIEYLAGFKDLKRTRGFIGSDGRPQLRTSYNRNLSNKLKLPVWRKIERNTLSSLGPNSRLLCRVRKYTSQEYYKTFTTKADNVLENDMEPFELPIYNKYFTLIVGKDSSSSEGDKQTQTGKTTENECHHHTFEVDPKGNGYTSYAYHPQSDKVRHRHKVINYVVQSAASDCYPNCEIEYGVKGVPDHVHGVVSDQQEQVDQDTMNITNQMNMATQSATAGITSNISGLSTTQGSY